MASYDAPRDVSTGLPSSQARQADPANIELTRERGSARRDRDHLRRASMPELAQEYFRYASQTQTPMMAPAILPGPPPHTYSSRLQTPSPARVFNIPTETPPPVTTRRLGNAESDKQLVMANFAAKAFAKVPVAAIHPSRPHLWYQGTPDEIRVWVVLNSIKAAGFDHVGNFLITLLSPDFNKAQPVYQAVATFLHGNVSPGSQPVDVVNAIYSHPYSYTRKNAPSHPTFPSLPRYTLPPSSRLMATSPPLTTPETTRNAMLDWALSQVLHEVDREAGLVLQPSFGLTSRQPDLTWSLLYTYSLNEKQEVLSANAPALFGVFATLATSSQARLKLENQASARIAAGAHAEFSMSTGDTRQAQQDFDGDSSENNVSEDSESESVRDPWLGATVAILMLLVFRYRFANMFQIYIGVLLFSMNAHRDIFRILSRIGLSTAYSTCLSKLEFLAEGESDKLKEWGKSLSLGLTLFQILFDNVNKAHHAWQKTLSVYDEVQSGTAGAVIKLEDVPPNAFDRHALEAHMRDNPRTTLTVDDLHRDIDWAHLRGVGVGTVMRIWINWIPALQTHRATVQKLFTETHQKHRLRLRKTEVITLRCSNIDESRTTGIDDVLMDIVLRQLCVLPLWLAAGFLFICGDQLTIDRTRKLLWYTRKAGNPFDRRLWARPTIQLWHMKWAWQKAIVRMHWWKPTERGTFGLHHDAVVLGREKYNPDKCDFYPTHHLLRDSFEAMVLDVLRILCEEETSITTSPNIQLLSALESYFADGAPLALYSFDQLYHLAEKVYDSYLCNAAYDDAFGWNVRDEAIYGPMPFGQSHSLTMPITPHINPVQALSRQQSKGKSREAVNMAKDRSFQGDEAMINTVNFMRATFWYTEFYAAVAEGDIGRVHEIIKVLRFSFWGAGSTNYGNELLELACIFIKEYPHATRVALMNNWLVNPSGLSGHWHELDLLMEHFNHWLKSLLVKKTLDFDSKFMKTTIALNLSGFQKLREAFPAVFGLKKTSGVHPNADRSADINRLGDHYRTNNQLRFCPGRTQAYRVDNEFGKGYEKLCDGQLAAFLARTSRSTGAVTDQEITNSTQVSMPGTYDNLDFGTTDDSLEIITEPSHPIILENGVSSIEDYLSPAT